MGKSNPDDDNTGQLGEAVPTTLFFLKTNPFFKSDISMLWNDQRRNASGPFPLSRLTKLWHQKGSGGVGGGPQNVTNVQVNNEQWGRVHLDSAAPSRFLWATTWRRTLPKARLWSWLTSSEKSWGRSRRTWWRATKAWSLRTWFCCPAAWRTASPSRSCFSPLLLLCYRAF